MRRTASLLAVSFVFCVVLAACGGTVVHGTGGTGAGTSGPSGDCKTDADCPQPGHCIELTAGGYKVCSSMPGEATGCMATMLDQCCTSADCANGGKCYSTTSLPYCAGPAMAEYNECVSDQCHTDTDCATDVPAICAPAGAFGYATRTCFIAFCVTDASCTAKPGGRCAPITQPCCGTPAGLGCVYPGGCAKDSDCSGDSSCTLDGSTGSGVCMKGFPGCPA